MKYLITILVLFYSLLGNATNYYVSSEGSDSNTGLSEEQAWLTFNKVNEIGFTGEGDIVFLKSGEYITGKITFNGADYGNVVFTTYGGTEPAIISGLADVTEWTNQGGNIWESTNAVSTLETCRMVVIDGAIAPLGRFPNATETWGGYLEIDSHAGDSIITNSTISEMSDFVGGQVAIRINDWTINRNPITEQTGDNIKFGNGLYYSITDGYGFFINDHINTLDAQNEWYYNSTTKKLSIYSTTEPTNVQVPTVDELFLPNKEKLTFNNIIFEGANEYASYCLWTVDSMVYSNCTFRYTGIGAMTLANATNVTFDNCQFHDLVSSGINTINGTSAGFTIENCTFERIGINAGMGREGQNISHYSAVYIDSKCVLKNNILDSVGYNPLSFNADSSIVENNYITNYNLVLQDGAGIYTAYNTYSGRIIRNNIITNGIGNNDGAIYPLAAYGIYIDDDGTDFDIYNNTVAHCSGAGFFLHGNRNIDLHDNTSFDCESGLLIVDETRLQSMSGLNIQDNFFIAKETDQWAARLLTEQTPIDEMGTFNNNYYTRPIDDDVTVRLYPTGYTPPIYDYNITQYKAYMNPEEANSAKSTTTITSTDELTLLYNATDSEVVKSFTSSIVDVTGQTYSGSVTITAFGSVVLIGNYTPVTPSPTLIYDRRNGSYINYNR